jgi:prevent-host-death family protein
MEILNASDAKREFGVALIKAQQGPVGINKNGKPVAVLVSVKEYAELQACRAQQLRQEIATGMDDIKSGKVSAGKDVMQRMRKRIQDANV